MQNRIIKKFLLLDIFLLFITLSVYSVPQHKGFVTDYAGVISESDIRIISAAAEEVKKKSGAEIAVLTVRTIEPYGSIEEFSIETAEKWGIGEKGKDNGILFVLSLNERLVRIEVGYGLEGAITDGIAGSIMDRYMIPLFKENKFSEGFKYGVLAVSALIAKEYNFEITGSEYNAAVSDMQGSRSSGSSGAIGFELIFLLFFLLGGGRLFWPLLFLSGMSGRRTYRGGFGSGFGGRSGGFSGGFGGFGGGSFGGGGASRSF